jgi:hypothetical protein
MPRVLNLADISQWIIDRLDENSLAEQQFVPEAQQTIFLVVWMLVRG